MVTLKQYIELEDKEIINFAWKYSKIWNKPVDVFKVGPLTAQSFGFVKDLQYDIEKGFDIEKAINYYKKLSVNLGNKEIDKVCNAYNYLIEEIKNICEVENALLTGAIREELFEAGIDELNELGVYLQIRQIALTFHITIEQARTMKYEDCLLELITQKRLADLENRLLEIRKRKKD